MITCALRSCIPITLLLLSMPSMMKLFSVVCWPLALNPEVWSRLCVAAVTPAESQATPLLKVAAVERQRANFALVHHVRERRRFSLQDRRFRCHRNGLRHLAQRELEIGAGPVLRVDRDAFPDLFLEPSFSTVTS